MIFISISYIILYEALYNTLYLHKQNTVVKIIIMTEGVIRMAASAGNREKILVEDLLSLADSNTDDFANIVNGDYAEVVRILGVEIALKMYIHFRGCHISFPKHFYKPDYVVALASKCTDKREREKIAIVCGYTAQWIERRVRESSNDR